MINETSTKTDACIFADTMLLKPGGVPGSVVLSVTMNQYKSEYLKLAQSTVYVRMAVDPCAEKLRLKSQISGMRVGTWNNFVSHLLS